LGKQFLGPNKEFYLYATLSCAVLSEGAMDTGSQQDGSTAAETPTTHFPDGTAEIHFTSSRHTTSTENQQAIPQRR